MTTSTKVLRNKFAHRIPDLAAAVAYLTTFNAKAWPTADSAERSILLSAEAIHLCPQTRASATGGYYIHLYDGYDTNGDFEVLVYPGLWKHSVERLRRLK